MSKSLSAAKSTQYVQCFLCREWSWSVSQSFDRVSLCLPCYVDVLEVRQNRQESRGSRVPTAEPTKPQLREGPDQRPDPRQLWMFEDLA